MTDQHPRGRVVHDIVDGEGLFFSRIATAGPFVFMASLPVDETGRPPADVQVRPPYHLSASAHCTAQTRYIYQRYVDLLPQVDSSIADVVQIEQYMPAKKYGDAYTEESRAPGFLDKGRPTSANICTGPLLPDFATIAHTGIAVSALDGTTKQIVSASTGYHESLTEHTYGESFSEEGPFNEVITAGPYVFTVGDTAVDYTTHDIHQDAKVDDFVWWGSEIRSETEFVLTRLETYLKRVGATLDDIVHMTVYLTDLGDLFELDKVWRRRFTGAPPARTVIPCTGLGIPAFDGDDLHHRDRAVRMEQMSQSVRPGMGYRREVVSTGAEMLGHESEAVKAGPLLWISQLLAGDASGAATAPDAVSQLEHIFARLAQICRAGGTSIGNLVRLRAFVTDPADGFAVYQMLKQVTPDDPPTVSVSAVPGPLHVPGCSVLVDAVAYVDDHQAG
jgi:enamine deaminase RidA (YjgF/YER057c/UK114 family)